MACTKDVKDFTLGDNILLEDEFGTKRACEIYNMATPEFMPRNDQDDYEFQARDVLDDTEVTKNFPAGTSLEVPEVTQEELEVESYDEEQGVFKFTNGVEATPKDKEIEEYLDDQLYDKAEKKSSEAVIATVRTALGNSVVIS